MFVISYFRSRHSTHDFADRHKEAHKFDVCIKTKGQDGARIFGRPFVTAGWIVVQVTAVVAAAEIALLVLIIRHQISVCFFFDILCLVSTVSLIFVPRLSCDASLTQVFQSTVTPCKFPKICDLVMFTCSIISTIAVMPDSEKGCLF